MNYVKNFNFFGTEAQQIPCMTGQGEPNTTTEGAVGSLYMDEQTGTLFMCTAAAGGRYTWENQSWDGMLRSWDGENAIIVEVGEADRDETGLITAGRVDFYNTDGDEPVRLGNIADGIHDRDAVTVGQMRAADFLAAVDKTAYADVLEAYNAGKKIAAKYENAGEPVRYAALNRIDGTGKDSAFCFVCDENGTVYHYVLSKTGWNNYAVAVQSTMSNLDSRVSKHDKEIMTLGLGLSNLPTTAFNKFEGGFQEKAGTLDIKKPGIYLVMQGGTGNKHIVITQNGVKVLDENWNAVIVLSSDSGVVTPIGIKSGLSMFATPGTWQGWVNGQTTFTTTISYPAGCVIWKLGNRQI